MAVATCTVTGTICDLDGSPNCEAQVVATVDSTAEDKGGQIAAGAGVTSVAIETFTDDAGAFSITLICGSRVKLEIPSINLSKIVTVPASGSVDFETLV